MAELLRALGGLQLGVKEVQQGVEQLALRELQEQVAHGQRCLDLDLIGYGRLEVHIAVKPGEYLELFLAHKTGMIRRPEVL